MVFRTAARDRQRLLNNLNSDTHGEALKMARIKAVLFGTGNMGRLIAGYLVEGESRISTCNRMMC